MILRPSFLFPIPDIVPTNVQFLEQDMGDAIISCSIVISPDINPVFSNDGTWAINFQGETYTLKTFSPPGQKDNTSLQYKYDLIFASEREVLKHRLFSTFTQLEDGSLQIVSQTWPFQADLNEFIGRLQQNLRYNFGSQWRLDLNPAISNSADRITVRADNVSIWDVLTQMFELYGVRWNIVAGTGEMIIKVGYPSIEVSHVFDYDDGLLSIQRMNETEAIYTRLFGLGGTRNIPITYFKDANGDFPADPDTNPNLQTGIFNNLRPISTRQYVQGWNDSAASRSPSPPADGLFYNMGFNDQQLGRSMFLPNYAQSTQEKLDKWGIREGVLENNEEIFPSIQGVWLESKGRADEIVAIEQVLSDDYEQEVTKEDRGFLVNAIATKTTMRQSSSQPAEWTDSISTEVFNIPIESRTISFRITGRSDRELYPVSDYDGSVTIDLMSGADIIETKNISLSLDGDILTAADQFDSVVAGSYTLRLTTAMTYTGTMRNGYPWIAIELGFIRSAMPSSSGNDSHYKQTFDIWIKDIWEGETGNIYDIWESKISSEELTIMFSDGLLAGEDREFIVARGPEGNPLLPDPNGNWYIWEDTSKTISTIAEDGTQIIVQSRWRLSLIKSDVELESSNMMLPNKNINAKPGDHFFFINIELPHQYIVWAEARLQKYLEAELAKIDEEYPTFSIKPSPIFCANFQEVGLLRAGTKLRLRNIRLLEDSYVPIFINSLTLRWPDDGRILPEWDVVISDRLIGNKSPIALLQGEIKRLSLGGYGSSGTDADTIRAMERIFLRKDGLPDTSYSPTRFTREVAFDGKAYSGDFRQGDFGGTGWGFYDDTNEASVLEVDKLVVRRQMRVNEILVNQIVFTGGKQVFSGAGGTIERVEENINGNSWRCYIDTKMGSLMNHFQVGDQAYHQDFDAANNELLRYYWRLVVRVGEDWIDLSKDDSDGSSIPQAGDNVATLGNRTDTSRQSALIIDMVRDGGGLVTWYDAISSYSLVAKDTVNIGRIDGQTWVQAYGNAYFGRRDEGRYFKVVDGQVSVRGALVVSAADPDITDFAIVNRGNYNDESVYAQGDRVNDPTSGNYYVYINDAPGAGHPVTSADYWRLDSTTSEAESMYTWVKYSDYKNPTDAQIFDRPEDTPSGNASWIGQAFNKPTPTESTVAADYVWLPFLNTDGRDGDSYEVIFKQSVDANIPIPPVEQIPAQQQDDWYPGTTPPYNYGWVDTFPGVTRTMSYCWAAERKKVAGVWTQFSPAKVFAKYGEDGHGQEWSYYRTTANIAPSTRPPSSGWTNDPQGVNAQYGWEWESTRSYENEIWGAWSTPTLHSIFSREGTSIKMAYCRYPTQPYYPSWNSGSSQAAVTPINNSPYYWSSNPPQSPADQPLWVSTAQTAQATNGQWSATNITAPVQLNGPAGLQGRSLMYQGEYTGGKAYTATAQTAAVVKRNGVFYYTTIQASGTVANIAPPNITYWTQFIGSFENIATNVLYAESGVLGDFVFSGSARTFTSQDGRLILNSNTGGITATSGAIGGFLLGPYSITAPSGTTGTPITISHNSIYFTNSTNTVQASVGINQSYGLTFPARFINHDLTSGVTNIALAVSARSSGLGDPIAIDIGAGMVQGLAYKTALISTGRTLTNTDTYLSCTNSSQITLYLPSPGSAERGKVYYIRAKNARVVISGTIDAGPAGRVSTRNIERGYIGMFVNDGVDWCYNWSSGQ